MVAYTPQLCLPYYEGTDSPCLNTGTVCEPSNVWCDLVNLVEPLLDDLDVLVARTSTAVPLAQVSYSPPDPAVAITGAIPFNVVDMDTDGMVDLDVYQGIIPNRNGVYQIDMVIEYDTSVDDDLVEAYITIGNVDLSGFYGSIVTGAIVQGNGRGDNNVANWPTLRASVLWPFTDTGPTPRNITVNSQYAGSPVVSAILTVSWHSDVS